MLRKLTGFELKKQLSGPFFVIALCLFIVVNILLSCGLWEYAEAVKDFEERAQKPYPLTYWEYQKGIVEQALSGYKTTRENYALVEAEKETFETYIKETYGEDILEGKGITPPEIRQQMADNVGYSGKKGDDSALLAAYHTTRNWNEDLQKTLNNAVETAKTYGRDAVQEGDSYGIRRNIDIIQLFTVPREKITQPIHGWDDFLFDTQTMLFVYLLVLLACGGSFSTEREQKTVYLLHTSKNGKGKTLAAKYLSGALIAAGLTVLFQIVTLAAVWYKSGYLGLNQPAAAMEQLIMLPWPLRVWQYLLIQLTCQILSAVLLSAIINTVSAVSKNSVTAYVAGVLALGVLMAAQFTPKEVLMGPLSLGDTVRYFSTYCTANIFGMPVLWVVTQSVLWLILCGGGIYAAHRVFHRKGKVV